MWGDTLTVEQFKEEVSVVLILVLVEDVGGPICKVKTKAKRAFMVLILVLVEDVGGHHFKHNDKLQQTCLNPCFGGRCGGTYFALSLMRRIKSMS